MTQRREKITDESFLKAYLAAKVRETLGTSTRVTTKSSRNGSGVYTFEAGFYNIEDRDAKIIDAKLRKILEIPALEDKQQDRALPSVVMDSRCIVTIGKLKPVSIRNAQGDDHKYNTHDLSTAKIIGRPGTLRGLIEKNDSELAAQALKQLPRQNKL